MITFRGTSVAEAVTAFEASGDDYLDSCSSRGEGPDRPYSGRFVVRVRPRLHRALAEAARLRGETLNAFVTRTRSAAVASD